MSFTIHSIDIRNFKGIDHLYAEVAEKGITLIEGDNGVGKTSLVSAVPFIFEYLDHSIAEKVKAIRPAGRDVSTEIKIDVSIGKYRITYEKKYHRNSSTRLEIHQPDHELLTGQDAHNRANQLLSDNVDIPLWRALYLNQGGALSKVDLSGQTSLGAALDQMAGDPVDNESENSLFQRVEQEYQRYFTEKTGQPNQWMKNLINKHESAVETLDQTQFELNALDEKVELITSLTSQISGLKQDQTKQKARVDELTQNWQKIEAHSKEVEALNFKAELASGEYKRAKSKQEVRDNLIHDVSRSEKNRDDVAARIKSSDPRISLTRSSYDDARDSLEKATSELEQSKSVLEQREADYEYRRDELDLELMTERHNRVKAATKTLSEADSFIKGCGVDRTLLDDIENAHTNVLTERARLDGEAAHLQLEAQSSQAIEIGGEHVTLSVGEALRKVVEGELTVDLPGMLRFTVTAAHGSEALANKLRVSETDLRKKFEAAGVSEIKEARSLYRKRVEVESNAKNARSTINENLRDLTTEQLRDRFTNLGNRIAQYKSDRTHHESLPADLDTARNARDLAAGEVQLASNNFDQVLIAFQNVEQNHKEITDSAKEMKVELRLSEDRLKELKSVLDDARKAEDDQSLNDQVSELHTSAAAASLIHQNAATALEQSDPEFSKAELETASDVVESINKKITKLNNNVADAKMYLSVKGEDGLHGQLLEARTSEQHSRKTLENEKSRADAANMLLSTIKAYRDASRERYKLPFAAKIHSLGKSVFGREIRVDLNDDLSIKKADVTGVMDALIPWIDLSGGETEQLNILFWLACASIVGETGSVPLIMDDWMVWSDPDRQKALGTVLKIGSRDIQVIALTCEPTRYQHVAADHLITFHKSISA